MSEIKVDALSTVSGSGNITVSNNIAGAGTISGTNITASGTLGVTGLITASAGVAIGGTGSANTLDDYEEGTWTPTSHGSGFTLTSVLDARYTKIGRMVQCSAQFTIPSNSNGAHAQIGGLPFTNLSGSGAHHGAFTVFTNLGSTATWLTNPNETVSAAYTLAGGSITNATLSTKQFRLVWIYQVN